MASVKYSMLRLCDNLYALLYSNELHKELTSNAMHAISFLFGNVKCLFVCERTCSRFRRFLIIVSVRLKGLLLYLLNTD